VTEGGEAAAGARCWPPVEASSAPVPESALESRRKRDRFGDTALRWVTAAATLGAVGLIGLIIYKVVDGARPAMSEFGISFVWHHTWDAVSNQFGALDFIFGTLYTTAWALLIGGPIAIAIGLYLSELAPRAVRGIVGSLVEMLAAIPSVVLGLWGILVLGPVVHETLGPWLNDVFGWTPFFSSLPASGSTVFTAVLVLTIMIVPITASISRDLFNQVPADIKEGAYGLGLTRWEMMRGVMLPFTRGGLVAAVLLGGGRAVGEAIAVTQVIGTTTHGINWDLFQTGDTLASRIAAQYQGAVSNLQVGSLFYLGVILLVMSLITNFAAQIIVRRYAIERH
jgi:phosphate transport system permease protein